MTSSDARPAGRVGRRRPVWRELPFLLLVALVLALLVKTFLVQAFSIPTGSMEHTLEVGDRVLVNKVVYRLRDPHRGEVIVFDGTDDWAPEGDIVPPHGALQKAVQAVGNALGVSSAGHKDYIKRVVGLPGDRVMCCNASGQVVVTARGGAAVALDEPYLWEAGAQVDPLKYFCAAGRGAVTCPPGAAGVLVPSGRLWVMGDHRGRSSDSRAHTDDRWRGTIATAAVVGRAFAVVYPVNRVGALGVPGTVATVATNPSAPYLLGLAVAIPLTGGRRRARRHRHAVR